MAGSRTSRATRSRSISTIYAPNWAAVLSKRCGGWAIVWRRRPNDADLSQGAIVHPAVGRDGAGLAVRGVVDSALDPRRGRAGAGRAAGRGGDHGLLADLGAKDRTVTGCCPLGHPKTGRSRLFAQTVVPDMVADRKSGWPLGGRAGGTTDGCNHERLFRNAGRWRGLARLFGR